jgi:hypothetical protein
LIDPSLAYVRNRLPAVTPPSARRLAHDIKVLGYVGAETPVTQAVCAVCLPKATTFDVRFETPPGPQTWVDFATPTPHCAPARCDAQCGALPPAAWRRLVVAGALHLSTEAADRSVQA